MPAPHLVARPEVISALAALMTTQRVVVVCGLPGSGKTTGRGDRPRLDLDARAGVLRWRESEDVALPNE
jgi:hypothetical protein